MKIIISNTRSTEVLVLVVLLHTPMIRVVVPVFGGCPLSAASIVKEYAIISVLFSVCPVATVTSPVV